MAMLVSALLIPLIPVSVYGTFTLTSSGDLLTGSTISIVCNIPTFTGTAGWKNPSISASAIHTCGSGFCVPSIGAYPRYAFSSTLTSFTLNITGATLDDDSWTCEQDTPADSGTITLGLKVAPTTCTLTESGGTYTCTTSCGYPKNDLYIQAKLNGTSNTLDLSPLNTESTPACTSPESAYSATVPTSFFTQDGNLYCECGVTGYPSTAIQSTSLSVKAPPVCDCIASIALMSLSIVITVITVVLLVVLYLAVYGKKEGLSVFRPKDKKSTKSARCELTKKSYLVIAIAITVISVIGFIIAVVGYVVCLGCDLNNNGETIGLILAVVGFVLTIVGLVVAVVLSALIGCGIIKIKTDENTNVKDGSEGQETNSTPLEQNLTTARSTGSPTSASKIRTRLPNNKVSDSNDSDGDSSTPRGKLDLVPRNRKLPPLEKPSELKPISVSLNNPTYDGQVINAQEQESTEVKKLKGKNKRKKLRKQKEETEKVIITNNTVDADDTVGITNNPLPNEIIKNSNLGTQVSGTIPEDQKSDTQGSTEGVTKSENTQQKPNMEPGKAAVLSDSANTQLTDDTKDAMSY